MIFENYIKRKVTKAFQRLTIEFKKELSKKDASYLGVVTTDMFSGNLQACLDSNRPSWLTKSEYLVSDTLVVKNPHKIVFGNISIIKPTKNIPVFQLKSKEFKIEDLIINTQLIEHSEAGFLIDANDRIWGGKLVNVRVEGKRETLYKTGMGTKALVFDTSYKVGAPYITDIDINMTAQFCNKGVYIPKQDNNRLWINNITFNTKMLACKQYYHICEGDMYDIFTTEGDESVLNEEEKGTFANMFHTKKSRIYIKPHDFRRKDSSPYHRHMNNFLDPKTKELIKDPKNMLIVENTSKY